MDVNEKDLIGAIRSQQNYYLENLESLSMKIIRRKLEKDLGLPEKGLDACKDLVSDEIDKILMKCAKENQQEGASTENQKPPAAGPKEAPGAKLSPNKPATKAKDVKPPPKKVAKKEEITDEDDEDDAGDSAESEEEDDDDGGDDEEREKVKGKKSTSRKTVAAVAKPKAVPHSRQVQKLKEICKAATISVPPNIYSRNRDEASLLSAFNDLLGKHGLSSSSGTAQIKAAKKKLSAKRELDGIDKSNIVDNGRPRRAAAQTDFKAMFKPPPLPLSDEDEEDSEEEDDDDDDESGSSSEVDEDEDDDRRQRSGTAGRRKSEGHDKVKRSGSSGKTPRIKQQPRSGSEEEESDASEGSMSEGSGERSHESSDEEENGGSEGEEDTDGHRDQGRKKTSKQKGTSPARLPKKTSQKNDKEDIDKKSKDQNARAASDEAEVDDVIQERDNAQADLKPSGKRGLKRGAVSLTRLKDDDIEDGLEPVPQPTRKSRVAVLEDSD